METALYFPYMQVPETAWFTQVLLYWDSVATIVPGAVRYDDSVVSRYMRELHKLELLDYVEPDRELSQRHDVFAPAFLALADEVPRPAGGALTFRRIHVDKVSWPIFDQLAQRDLALRDPGGGEWWSVESSTAELYLAYLAGALCGWRSQGDVVAQPVSDRLGALAGFSTGPESCVDRLRDLRCSVIMDALPVPGQALPPVEIRRFKDHYADELSRLRLHFDQRLRDIAELDHPDEREWRAKLAVEEIRHDIEVLREEMAKRRWPKIVFLGLGGVVGADKSPLALSLAVGRGLDSAFDDRAPLAYAALAPR